jgi:5-formyltetrahydrofolate cyclo-ligase
MLGFDLQMNRLGYGGGYYDRLLRTHTIPMTIGLCYEMNKYTAIPIEEHDIKMNYIITELKCYKPASPP